MACVTHSYYIDVDNVAFAADTHWDPFKQKSHSPFVSRLSKLTIGGIRVTISRGLSKLMIFNPVVFAGGIGRWEGAHGEDMDFFYDPVKQTGGGKIVLTCLKGVC